jgi:hypothetical protein
MKHTAAVVLAALLGWPAAAIAQGQRADYARAEQFLNDDIRKLAYDGQVDAHWMPGTSRFWYLKDAMDGKEFLIFDAASGAKSPAFDHQRLAAAMTRVPVSATTRAAVQLRQVHGRRTDRGRHRSGRPDLRHQRLHLCKVGRRRRGRGRPQWTSRQADPTRLPRTEKFSPDRKFAAFVREHNLWVRSVATGEQIS